ncbi:UNVERIFIED_ORG: hypothetical protein ABIC58_000018 [Leuconostoc holzapfelii]
MKSAIQFKTDQIKSLLKRKNNLLKRNESTLPSEVPFEVKSELEMIDRLLQEFDINQSIYDERPTMIGIKNSRDEEWYFQQMKHWVVRHPHATNGQFGKSAIYKYALHFFVENIALNSENARLDLSELTQKVNGVGSQKKDNQLSSKIANIEEQLGFLLTMQQRQLSYIPEVVDQQTGIVKYAINPINKTEIEQFGAPTEINPNTDLAQTYSEYKKVRSRDKQLIQKYHQLGGQIRND